jgi:hypothetical protein
MCVTASANRYEEGWTGPAGIGHCCAETYRIDELFGIKNLLNAPLGLSAPVVIAKRLNFIR